jgi:hypothetical protein
MRRSLEELEEQEMKATRHFVGAAFVSALMFAAPAFAVEINQPAPNFTGKTADGTTVTLDQLRGKTVVLEWTNDGCPYVRKHYNSKNMQGLQKDYTGQGIVWVQIISSPPGMQGYADGPRALALNTERGAVPTKTVLDPEGKVGRLYGAQTTPHMYIVDAKGTLVYKGGIDSIASSRQEDLPKAVNYVREALDAMAAGKSVPNPSTRAYGCTIHYSS